MHQKNHITKQDYIQIAKDVFTIEAQSIQDLSHHLSQDFSDVVELILQSKGRLVVSGMGKSGHIGVKISATLASTGTPSFFLHPAEAIHGDLGMLTKDDIVLAISNSGESEEIIRIIPIIQKMQIPLIAMAGKKDSTLAKEANYFLDISIKKEACPLQLAPMSSTTATLAMGDALAAVLMKARNFQPEDFALYHPGGSLGKKLLTKVKDIMHTQNLPILMPQSSFTELIKTMTSGKLGLCIVMQDGVINGIITDGDLRRALEQTEKSRFELLAKDIMTASPKTISQEAMAVDAEAFMLTHKINNLLVTHNNTLVGVVQLFDTGNIH
ncbi:Arabinose 5-phosphate isomerase [hydrothermal vent metagenome]|uniref:Arabinose 5-phosphate isomerase n=1 Tax=hydrothermal vent metagenome TaxID=652676 RepID=A0A1W1D4T4_9ZZZZ